MGDPKTYIHILTPRTYEGDLFWKKVFTDIIKVVEMRLPWITWVTPKSNDKCP